MTAGSVADESVENPDTHDEDKVDDSEMEHQRAVLHRATPAGMVRRRQRSAPSLARLAQQQQQANSSADPLAHPSADSANPELAQSTSPADVLDQPTSPAMDQQQQQQQPQQQQLDAGSQITRLRPARRPTAQPSLMGQVSKASLMGHASKASPRSAGFTFAEGGESKIQERDGKVKFERP